MFNSETKRYLWELFGCAGIATGVLVAFLFVWWVLWVAFNVLFGSGCLL